MKTNPNTNSHSGKRRKCIAGLAFAAIAAPAFGADRINQEGRILGPVPVVTQPILFNTAQADAVATPFSPSQTGSPVYSPLWMKKQIPSINNT